MVDDARTDRDRRRRRPQLPAGNRRQTRSGDAGPRALLPGAADSSSRARRRASGAGAEQFAGRSSEAGNDRRDAPPSPDTEDVDARRCQLERQRNAVEPATNLQNRRHVRIGKGEPIHGRHGALVEQLDRRVAQSIAGGKISRIRREFQRGQAMEASPSARSGSRLVVKMLTPGAAFSTASASAAAASITCSQLSSTISAALSRNQAANPGSGLAPEGGIPSAAPRALGTRSGSEREASPTNHAPSLYDRASGVRDRDAPRWFCRSRLDPRWSGNGAGPAASRARR